MSAPRQISFVIPGKPVCPECGRMGINLAYHPIPDGATTILTGFTWGCANGHEWPAPLPDTTVPASDADHALEIAIAVAPPSAAT